MIYTPSSELVAVAWLRSLNLPLTSDVSTTLPAPNRWSQPCYVQATSAGARGVRHGSVNAYEPGRDALIRVDVWSGPKRFGEASSVAEEIVNATYESVGSSVELNVRTGWYPVHLAEVTVWQPPVTIRDTIVFSAPNGAAETVKQNIPASSSQSMARASMLLAMIYQIVRS